MGAAESHLQKLAGIVTRFNCSLLIMIVALTFDSLRSSFSSLHASFNDPFKGQVEFSSVTR